MYNKHSSQSDAERLVSKYKNGDKIDLYYNKNNLEDIRFNIYIAPNSTIYILEMIIVLLQLFC